MIALVIVCCAVGVNTQVPHVADSDQTPAAPLSPARSTLSELIQQLGSPQYHERHQATERLKGMDRSLTEELRRIMPTVRDHEVRLRIREIVEHLFYRDVMEEMGGFLGIQLSAVTASADPRLAGLTEEVPFELDGAVMIDGVVADTAAQRGGLRAGDLIIGLDGQSVKATRGDPSPFIERIKAKPPGTRVDLTIFRHPEVLNVTVLLGYRKLDPNVIAQHPNQLSAIKQAQQAFERWCRQAAPGD